MYTTKKFSRNGYIPFPSPSVLRRLTIYESEATPPQPTNAFASCLSRPKKIRHHTLVTADDIRSLTFPSMAGRTDGGAVAPHPRLVLRMSSDFKDS